MTISKNSKMMNVLNHRLRVTMSDGRVLTGQMLAFDKHMNLVLADCQEFRKVKAKAVAGKPSDDRERKRTLGLVVLRGETIVSISVDAPPPPSAEQQRAKAAQLPTGPGIGRPAGRGLPVAMPGMPPMGLAGPVRGVGGPAPSMMLPRGNGPPPMPAMSAAPTAYSRPPPPGFRPGVPPPGMPGAPPPGFRPPPMPFPGMRPPPPGMPGMPPPGFPGRGLPPPSG
ncbi:Small nuclear ribonucleoprotein-associated protein B [Dimargaris verticillata]|uniref:Sm protein B n=1 Tax=Dimargaris verticillata TaxID=2761393 RepID=A0A9W8BCF9_9FUNG|nr:Small nuclear ribonucleoprotein-associated protein B [Dimargaris verticillata]